MRNYFTERAREKEERQIAVIESAVRSAVTSALGSLGGDGARPVVVVNVSLAESVHGSAASGLATIREDQGS